MNEKMDFTKIFNLGDDANYKGLSLEGEYFYAKLVERLKAYLTFDNKNFIDANGCPFVYMDLAEIAVIIRKKSDKSATNVKKELKKFGLIDYKNRYDESNQIYVFLPVLSEENTFKEKIEAMREKFFGKSKKKAGSDKPETKPAQEAAAKEPKPAQEPAASEGKPAENQAGQGDRKNYDDSDRKNYDDADRKNYDLYKIIKPLDSKDIRYIKSDLLSERVVNILIVNKDLMTKKIFKGIEELFSKNLVNENTFMEKLEITIARIRAEEVNKWAIVKYLKSCIETAAQEAAAALEQPEAQETGSAGFSTEPKGGYKASKPRSSKNTRTEPVPQWLKDGDHNLSAEEYDKKNQQTEEDFLAEVEELQAKLKLKYGNREVCFFEQQNTAHFEGVQQF